MLVVPTGWNYSSSCACVQFRGEERYYICSAETGSPTRLRFRAKLDVLVESKTLIENCFCDMHEYAVLFTEENDRAVEYIPNDSTYGCVGETQNSLRLWRPVSLHSALSITVSGPREQPREALSAVRSALVGKFLVLGCSIVVNGAVYTLVDCELQSGLRGVAFVGANCHIKINRRFTAPANKNIELVSLDSQKKQLDSILRSISLNSKLERFVMVHGPNGCGVHAVVNNCLKDFDDEVEVTHWHLNYTCQGKENSLRVQLLLIDPLEKYFPEDDDYVAEMSRRVLLASIKQLSRRGAVVVIGLTHFLEQCSETTVNSIFSYSISIALPDMQTRRTLIAKHRPESSDAELDSISTSMGGLSCREVILAAQSSSWQPHRLFSTSWNSIRGLDEVKNKIIQMLMAPQAGNESFSRFNIEPVKGILLYGPPGCSKTSMVKAICSESGFSLIYLESARLLSAYVGESERELRDTFRRARQSAPCIVFFDEIEVIGTSREAASDSSSNNRLLATLLTELDGFSSSKGVCFIGATNVPNLLDSALLRPGRFDHLIYIPLPDQKSRVDILEFYLPGLPIDLEKLSANMEGFSGADIKSFCSSALLEIADQGSVPHLDPAAITTEYFLECLETFSHPWYDTDSIMDFIKRHSVD